MDKSNARIVGIDLGTTNSLVAYCDERGPRVIDDGSGPLLPSVVRFDGNGEPSAVGRFAREGAVESPRNTIHSVKRLMGRGFADLTEELDLLPYQVVRRPGDEPGRDVAAVQIGHRVYTPPEISAIILANLKQRAEAHFFSPIDKAVITVPAYFDDSQRQATRDAGRIAGLDVVRLVNEPTAAALAYGLDQRKQGTLAVYDLGGGTFDVSILSLHDGVFEVLSTHGDTHLGGDDFDRAIMDLAQGEIHEQFGLRIDTPAIMQALRTFAENVKIALSVQARQTLQIDLGQGRHYVRAIQTDEFETLIAEYIERTLASCQKALQAAKLSPDQIDEVIMVGGSTRIPLVRKRVEAYFGRTPYTALDPDQVVALGASVQAAMLAGTRTDSLLLDVTPLALGIETLGGAMGKLITANTRVPCKATETFTTFQDGQTAVKINVLQGERELAADCRSLGIFELRGVPPMPAGIPKIDVTFLIDQNGILIVSAKEQRSGVEAGIQVIPSHGLTREEVNAMRAESVRHAHADMASHRLIDLRNQVAFDTGKAEQMLAAHGHLLGDAERQAIGRGILELRSLASGNPDHDELHRRLQIFGESTRRLAELGITETLKQSLKQS